MLRRVPGFAAAAVGAVVVVLAGCPPSPSAAPPTSPPPPPAPPGPRDPRAALAAVVSAHCLRRDEPWALTHAVLVHGAGLRLPGGELAVDVLLADNVRRAPDGTLELPRERAGRLVEAHPGYLVKVLLEVGVPLDHTFQAGGREATLRELVRAEAGRVREQAPPPGPDDPPALHNEEWRLEILAAAAELEPELAPRVERLRERALAVLAENQAYFEAYRRDPTRRYEKPWEERGGQRRAAHIHRYFCGGFHFFQAVQRLHGRSLPPGLAHEYDVLLARLELESGYWAGKLAEAGGDPRHVEVILAQELKVLGHGLETYRRAERAGVLAPDAGARRVLDAATARLADVVRALDGAGIYRDLERLRGRAPQLYLDLVGDSAHALHAWALGPD